MAQRIDYQTLAAAGMRALGGVYMYVTRSGLPPSLITWFFCAPPKSMVVPTASTCIRGT
jgi:hypothetical protein